MPQQMAQQILSLVLDGTTYLLINNNNNNDNNININTLVNSSTINPLTYTTMEEETVVAQPSSNDEDLNPRVEEGEESVDLLSLLDFSALTASLREEEEKEEEKGIPIPKTVLEMDQEEEEEEEKSLFQDERASAASAACHPFAADLSASLGPDLASLLGSASAALDPGLLTSSSSLDLLLHTPTTPTTSPWQLITTNTFPGDHKMSLASGTSFPFMSASSDDCHPPINSVVVTLPLTPASASSCQITASSPMMNGTASSSSSSSSADDVSSFSSSSSSDVSTPGFDEVMSFNDVFLAGIRSSPNSPHDVMPVDARAPGTLQLADVTVQRHEENSTSWNEGAVAAAPEVLRVVTSGNGAQCLLLLPADTAAAAPDKMAEEAAGEKMAEKMAEAEEEKMAAEAVEVLETCSLTPLVKEELKYTIQSRRLAAGKAELAPLDVSSTRICRRRRAATRGGKKSLTTEEREMDGKRREQNREAAQRFRQKQKDTEIVLSKKCRKLEGSNSSLREEILRLAREVHQLQQAMDTHLPSCSRAPQVTQ